MSKSVLIAIIAVCAVAIAAGAVIATGAFNAPDNSNSNDNGNDNSNNGGNSSTPSAATMTGISVLYDGMTVGDTIYVTYDDAPTAEDKITAKAVYSDNTTKSITGYDVTSTLSDSYSVDDTFTITVTYGEYSKTVTATIKSNGSATVEITCTEGTADCYEIVLNPTGEYTITFSGITEDSVYSISGTLKGNIIIDVSEDYDFELELKGLSLSSSYNVPIDIESADNAAISAKKNTTNSITDNRSEVDDDGISACIYSLADLDIKGKGTLSVTSVNNNGIHTKDDLSVKNLTLTVSCKDNALKGNDSVTVESGTITLIAKTGDCIKTTNSDINNDKQRGTITICSDEGDLTMNLYAACDGIDAAYDVSIYEGTNGTVTLNIYTDQYSSYSEEVTDTSDSDILYLRTTTSSYKYSVFFCNSSGTSGTWVNAVYYTSESDGMGMGQNSRTYYYYTIAVPDGYDYMKVYTYSSSQSQGQSGDYTSVTRVMAINTSYNMITIENSRIQWSSYGKSSGMGPGMQQEEGNTDKGEYSTKGLKAGNSITIKSGTIFIKSYDDAIHANGGETLENTYTSTGNVTVSGGTLTLYSNDDGIHGDGAVLISGGTVTITYSYEGLEGTTVTVSGGDVSVTSKDDGINGTATSGTAVTVSGGELYVYAGGDGIDSNSTTRSTGIVISGGNTAVISTSGGNSSVDSENGWTYSGGKIIAISPSGSMTQETTNCTASSGKEITKSISGTVSKGTYVTVTVSGSTAVAVKIPVSMNGMFVAYCGGVTSATIATSSGTYDVDSDGVYWA